MGLAERRAAMEFEVNHYPELKRRIDEAAGFPVTIEVDWESLSKESAYLSSWNRGWPKIYFEPIIEAFKEICVDDMGRAALREKLAKIVVQNKKTSYSSYWSAFADRTLTLDYMFTNVDDVEDRTTVLLKTLMDALQYRRVTTEELVAALEATRPMLDAATCRAAISAHAPREGIEAWCASCRVPELALAIAARRSDAAITELEQTYGETIGAVCRRFEGRGHTADDLRQILRTKLFVGEEPAITQYNGQGSLESWLRVIATRTFIDLGRRKDRARETAEDPGELDAIAPQDLALDLVKAEYRTAVAAALAEAARQLAPGDRHVLRQHLVGGLTIDQIAAVLGIHRATAARRITKAREQLAEKTRAAVAARLALGEAELAEIFGLVISKLDLSLRRLLESKPR